jgi:Zn-dependent protease
MFKSWRLGRMFGFPVEINLSFLLLLAVVFVAYGGVAGVLVVGLAFGSVLLHELGHALVARRLGVHVSGIELSFFGGAAKMVQMPRSADREIAIAAAGPAVSLMLGGAGLGLGLLLHATLLGQFFAMIGWINLVLAGFNLIPALPMDGGRILRALLTRRMDYVRATDVAVQVSRVFAVGFGLLGLLGSYQLLVLAPLLWMMGTRERMLARAVADPYGGSGGHGDIFRRGDGAFYPPGGPPGGSPDWHAGSRPGMGPGGFTRRGFDTDPEVRQFTIRQVGNRLVIEPLDRSIW